MTFEITACEGKHKAEWDAFVAASRNGTFLLKRDYMDYHADRFRDASLLAYHNGVLRAVLPANREGDVVTSHGGLTYGGFVVDAALTQPLMLELFADVCAWLKREGVATLSYKTIPPIYHRHPAQDDLYALFRLNARLCRRDVLSVIDCRNRLPYQQRRARTLRKSPADLAVGYSEDYAAFWDVLAENLRSRYDRDPVHSVAEIRMLAGRFPENIRLATAVQNGSVVAGAVVYVTDRVCHVQYNAASGEGKAMGALDAVLDWLIREFEQRVAWFDFGVSTESDGTYLNTGLVEYKEGFGARSMVHDFYELDLKA